MKKIFAIVLTLCLFLLVGCDKKTIFVNEIRCYVDGVLVEGTLQTYDGTNWALYDGKKEKKSEVYVVIDVKLGSSLEVEFDVVSPELVIDEMKIRFSDNFQPVSVQSGSVEVKAIEEGMTRGTYTIETVDPIWDTIDVYGWLTDQGPKYQGQKKQNTNYVLCGVHINYLP